MSPARSAAKRGVVEDDPEQVVEVVRDASGELSAVLPEVERLTSGWSWGLGFECHAGLSEEAGEQIGLLLAGAESLTNDVGEVVDAVDGRCW